MHVQMQTGMRMHIDFMHFKAARDRPESARLSFKSALHFFAIYFTSRCYNVDFRLAALFAQKGCSILHVQSYLILRVQSYL